MKNKDGVDSPETARRDMVNLAAKWLEEAGMKVPRDAEGNALVPVEVSPRFALDREELIEKIAFGRVVEGVERPIYLE